MIFESACVPIVKLSTKLPQLCRPLSLEWSIEFEHVVQHPLNTRLGGSPFLANHTSLKHKHPSKINNQIGIAYICHVMKFFFFFSSFD